MHLKCGGIKFHPQIKKEVDMFGASLSWVKGKNAFLKVQAGTGDIVCRNENEIV